MKMIWCFDLWFTLIKPLSTITRTYADVLVEAGVSRNLIFPIVRDNFMTRRLSYAELNEFVCSCFNITDERVLAKARERWIAENQNIRWIGNASYVLQKIHERGDLLVLITNTTEMGWRDANTILGIAPFFTQMFLSWEQGLAKPNPKVFTRVMSWFPNADPTQFVMVGDSETDDIENPSRLGWKTFLTNEGIDDVLDRFSKKENV